MNDDKQRPAGRKAAAPGEPEAAEGSSEASNSDSVWKREEPESPCVKVCVIHPASGYCLGCGRTIDEISAWPRLDAQARGSIRAKLPGRLAVTPARRGGRRGRLGRLDSE